MLSHTQFSIKLLVSGCCEFPISKLWPLIVGMHAVCMKNYYAKLIGLGIGWDSEIDYY